jgi:hypothetical protein
MGQTGVPGDVDDHLWKRIKTALMLSTIEFAGNAGTVALEQGRSNTYLNFNGVSGTANSLAQMAFGRDLNIPPPLYRGPGQPLTVYVNHYVDLLHFYQGRVRSPSWTMHPPLKRICAGCFDPWPRCWQPRYDRPLHQRTRRSAVLHRPRPQPGTRHTSVHI